MHPSLDALLLDARAASSPAMARGILAEAQDLLRNALDHGEAEPALARWFSRTLQELAGSPVVEGILEGSRLVFTGAVGRGDATPTDPLSWLLIGDRAATDEPLRDLFESTGLRVGERHGSASREQWLTRAREGEAAVFIDAGLLTDPAAALPLIAPSVRRLPAPLRLTEGMPDPDTRVDVRETLLEPPVAVARWAGLAAGTSCRDTLGRLRAAAEGEVLTRDEADSLSQAWATGLALELRHWRFRRAEPSRSFQELAPLDRSAYGAAARLVSVALRSLAGRHGIDLP